jgi:hypothetical protein
MNGSGSEIRDLGSGNPSTSIAGFFGSPIPDP